MCGDGELSLIICDALLLDVIGEQREVLTPCGFDMQTKLVQKAMNEKRFDEAVKLRGGWESFHITFSF